MNENASQRERAAVIAVAGFYLFSTLVLSENVASTIGAAIYILVATILIWYSKQIAMIPIHRGMYWLKPIPPIYIRCAGWLLLLWPVAITLLRLFTMPLPIPVK